MTHSTLSTVAPFRNLQPGRKAAVDPAPVHPAIGRRTGETLRAINDPLVPTIFHSRWWLEAATDGAFDEIEVRSAERVVARMPFVTKTRHRSFRTGGMPQLTHFLGPAVDAGRGMIVNRRLKQFDLVQALLEKLPALDSFDQRMHRGIEDTLAFEEAGFSSRADFTYEIWPQSVDVIWRQMRDKTRNVIRRAEERFEVGEWNDPEGFAAFYEINLRSLGQRNRYSRIAQVCAAAIARDQGRILVARDPARRLQAGIFTVWDNEAAYHLLATRTPSSDNSVISLLVWNALRHAVQHGRIFDFDGIGSPGNRLFFNGFGGRITPRFVVARSSMKYRVVRKAVGLILPNAE